jgi:hypothetical protein
VLVWPSRTVPIANALVLKEMSCAKKAASGTVKLEVYNPSPRVIRKSSKYWAMLPQPLEYPTVLPITSGAVVDQASRLPMAEVLPERTPFKNIRVTPLDRDTAT